MLGVMVTASVLAVAWGARDRSKPQAPARELPPEKPWLSKEAAAEIVGPGGTLGPLFVGLTFGLPPPVEERARIAAFARANDVAIDLETEGGELVAIRFDVEYGGCCGYEGAEVLALRAHRPLVGGGYMRGPARRRNAWSIAHEDGTFVRARVDINRASFRWEMALATDDVIAAADQLLDADTTALARKARERWSSIERGRFALELPYETDRYESLYADRNTFVITADERGRAAMLVFTVHDDDDQTLREILTKRWGRPSVRGSVWRWSTADRIVEADSDERGTARITITRRAVRAATSGLSIY